MLKSERLQNMRQKLTLALDQRTRAITAGLGLKELRAVLRGDPPSEKPNPRYKVHTTSFLFHIRPRYYEKASTLFTNTFRLGFFTSFFFFVELFTGLILMVYYTPSPEGAYQSILNLMSNVPYGKFLRDLHRLGAEGMVIFTVLHMLRTFFTASYKKERSFTWLTGGLLLFTTLILSFSGYLLPWDQLAYWAVTIGTSMAEAAPVAGNEVNLLLRGAPDIGAGGLLRFYLLHVVLLPLAAILIISIHYYKVAREHGISLPPRFDEGNVTPQEKKEGRTRIDYIPDLLTHEVFLTAVGLFALVLGVIFFYQGAPLEHHANPQATPLDTKAPWYFWWLQGMLKIDPANIIETTVAKVGLKVELSALLPSKLIMGLILPPLMFLVLLALPYLDKNPARSLLKRPWATGIGLVSVLVLVVLSYMGTPLYAIETPAATRILQDLAPEEGEGPLREIPYDQLVPGTYQVGATQISADGLCSALDFGCPSLEKVFSDYADRINEHIESGELQNGQAFMIIEDWQQNLKKITMRVIWNDSGSGEEKTYEQHIFLHKDRLR